MSDTFGHSLHAEQDAQSARDASALCQACGICCNGTLFSYVDITEKQADQLSGTPVATRKNQKGKLVFDLPCAALAGTCCTIYDKRPTICRTYLCKLTRGVMNGSRQLDAALEAVEDMKSKSSWLLTNAPIDVIHAYPPPNDTNPRATLAPKPNDTRGILAAWQRPKQRAKSASPAPYKAPGSLWLLLTDLYGAFCRKQDSEPLNESDKSYIFAAFSYAKLADREFDKTSLLRKYGSLVQGL